MSLHLTAYLSTLRLFNRDVRLYLLVEALNGFTLDGGIYAVLFNLYLLRLGYGLDFIGLINALGLLAFGLFSLPAGLLSGRWGNRLMIILGLSIMLIGCSLLPLAERGQITWQTNWLIATYIFTYMGLALYIANANPFLMQITTATERQHVFSMGSALWLLAGFVGNIVGGWLPALFSQTLRLSLSEVAPYRFSLYCAALFLAPAILAMRRTRPVKRSRVSPQVTVGRSLSFRPIALLALVRLLQVTGVASVFIFLNVYLDNALHAPTTLIGGLFALGRLCAAPAALLAPVLAARWGKGRIIIWATTGISLSLLPVAFTAHWGTAAFSFVGVTALTALRLPTFLVYALEAMPPTLRGTMSGAGEMANGLGFAIIGLGGSYLIAAFGYPNLFLLSASLTALGTFIFWTYDHYTARP